MKILILEDEHLVAESLIKLVKQLEPGADISGPVASVKEAKDELSATSPDLIISDIQLADGIALDLFTESNIKCPVIFTTAFNEYAIRAFKVNSVDYLLKPVDKKELKSALDKFHLLQSKFSNDVYLQQIGELFNNFKNGKKYITDYRSLDEIEELLDPVQFFRANRQFIIDLSYIETMRSDESGKVIVRLKLGGFPEIIVSKEKAAAFRKWVEG